MRLCFCPLYRDWLMTLDEIEQLCHWLIYEKNRPAKDNDDVRCLLFMGWLTAKYQSDPNAKIWQDLNEFKAVLSIVSKV